MAHPASYMDKPNKYSILLVDDSPEFASALCFHLRGVWDIEDTIPRKTWEHKVIQNYLRARRRWLDQGWRLGLDNGRPIDVIGININIATKGTGAQLQRSYCHGLKLLEWLRTELHLVTSIVLWSFLKLDILRARGCPSLDLASGWKYRRLPVLLVDLKSAFEQARESGYSRQEDLEVELGSLYPGMERWENPLRRMDTLDRDRVKMWSRHCHDTYQALSGEFGTALNALKCGDGADFINFLAGKDWREFVEAAGSIDGGIALNLEQAGIEITHLVRKISQYSNRSRGSNSADLADHCRVYADGIGNSLQAIQEWSQEI